MKKIIELKINGDFYEIAVKPSKRLLSVIRDDIGLTGTKEGCGKGDCGACTVLMNGKVVNSCLVLAIEAQGKEIITIEGVAENGDLHPVQQALIDYGAVQCGFCTPGIVLTAKALLDENPNPSEEEIRDYLSGNICRCTGYVKIVQAIKSVRQIS
ncbi:MAG: (2Fe-2S)-binding protein [Candidatus Schekmanbacteria bacterium RBG_16_38_11]|uniref:(2Fe-2S)-binding protein n=1 Tax=Candidatus Schekmanbacteria bacterium RBG_16_38_11 TaxID=1817880 RepID=A0A1F7S1B7_9BACT|nr:MAG: (2Fe-2S)-binding protein [Candidatus Schekmanbacteria bacterium RBG_16_38_11]